MHSLAPSDIQLMTKAPLAVLLLVIASFGCKLPAQPDPHDPGNADKTDVRQLQANVTNMYNTLQRRVIRGEISSSESEERLRRYAGEIVRHIDWTKLPIDEIWEYGDIVRTAQRWDLAEKVYAAAVENAKGEDRRINDTLRYALALAHNGKSQEAIKMAKQTFESSNAEKAPILPAVYLEIAPAGAGKGHDAEFAQLVREAVEQHKLCVVDEQSESGAAFLRAKKYHIRKALALADRLEKSGEIGAVGV
jgi:hypothetical protein